MILYGRNHSPFVRRVAVTLQIAGIDFSQEFLSTVTDMDRIFAVNPMGRVPALKIGADDILIDSLAIIDWLQDEVGAHAIRMPVGGPARRVVNQVIAGAIGAQEKIVAGIYHRRLIPEEKRHQPWIDRVEGQALGALAQLEARLTGDWFVGEEMSQADIAAAICITFARVMSPGTVPDGKFPRLDALTARLEATPAFVATYPK